jgi:3-(3-hydroxy-phenyl)propionate hydroxylase
MRSAELSEAAWARIEPLMPQAERRSRPWNRRMRRPAALRGGFPSTADEEGEGKERRGEERRGEERRGEERRGDHLLLATSRLSDMTRQAAAYRERRVLLAGDAAHVHPPVGGQGLNIGVQDAVNLGWKLALVVKRISPESLLDTYHTERHPVAARVLHNTMAQVALRRPDDRTKALGEIVSELLGMDEPRRRLAGMMSGLDVHYDAGEGHPLLGRRMPDLDLVTADGPVRVFTLLHDARPVLLNLGEPGGFDITPWADRVQLIDAKYVGAWELPAIGAVTAATAVLIRPDGYVAWVGDLTQLGLADALAIWFGPPVSRPVSGVS